MHSPFFFDIDAGLQVDAHARTTAGPALALAQAAAAGHSRQGPANHGSPDPVRLVTDQTGQRPMAARFFIDGQFDAPSGRDLQEQPGTVGAAGEHGYASEVWSEADIGTLHWRLLQESPHLADPATPLEEKLDTLRTVFTEREKDGLPFSFVNCLRVVGCSTLSPIACCGLVDTEAVRERIRHGLRPWQHATLVRHPDLVREGVVTEPEWVEARRTRNPLGINEQIKQMSVQGALFA